MSAADSPEARAAAVRFAMARIEAGRSTDGLRARVVSTRPEGETTRVRVSVEAPLSSYVSRCNARTGEPLGWFFERMMVGLDQGGVPESECLLAAREAAAPPEGAVLHRFGFEDVGGSPVFVAHWRHEHDGIPVEGDSIVVNVNGRTGKPFSLHRRWHTVDEEPSER